MRRPNNLLKAHIVLVCGGSGSGKSWWTKTQTAHEARALVFDYKDEYGKPGPGGYHRVTRLTDLKSALIKVGAGPGRYAFVGNAAEFESFCWLAYHWGNCVVIAEELSAYTSQSKAPPGWHACITRGRGFGMKVYGVSQRPMESDKTIIGNATLIHCGKLKRAGDREYMAKEMDLPVSELARLKPLEWVEVSDEGDVRRGRMGKKG